MKKFIGIISIILGILFFVPLGDGDTINAIKFIGSVIGFFLGIYALFLKQFLTGIIGIILNLISVALLIFVAGFLTFALSLLNSDAVQSQIQAASSATQTVAKSTSQTTTNSISPTLSPENTNEEQYYPAGFSKQWIYGKFLTSEERPPFCGKTFYQIPNTGIKIQIQSMNNSYDPKDTIKEEIITRYEKFVWEDHPNSELKFIKSIPDQSQENLEDANVFLVKNIQNGGLQGVITLDGSKPGADSYHLYCFYAPDLTSLKAHWPAFYNMVLSKTKSSQ